MKKIATVSLLLLLMGLVGCTTVTTSPAESFKGQSAQQIFSGGEEALAKGHYSKAVQHFEALDVLYPFEQNAEQAMLDSIYAYYKAGDNASAIATADRFLHLYPRNPHADYVYYMKGLANYEQDKSWFLRYLPVDWSERDLGSARQAFKDFSELVRLYPSSRYAADARQRMVHLRNILARSEMNVATYYMQREAYVAAANRANYIVQHYQQTPSVQEALVVMVKAYRKLGLPERANEAMRVLELNYPNSSVVKELRG